MTTLSTVTINGLIEVMEVAWLEADLLDHADYDAWLALWTDAGRYIVPVEPGATDFENSLNYAYDDHALRRKRVERLTSGFSISASPVARTIRSLSRFRVLSNDGDAIAFRCMQHLVEFRRDREHSYTADIEFRVVRAAGRLKIDRKIIRLINAGRALGAISYIL